MTKRLTPRRTPQYHTAIVTAVALLAGCQPSHPRADGQPTQAEPRVLLGLEAPMRDGIVLKGDLFLPPTRGRYPIILELTPYGRGPSGINYRSDAPYWTSRGYGFALFDTRGQGESGGTFEFMRDGQDGSDLIGWLAGQAWSSGSIGMLGSSYTGSNQWLVAREMPPALKCLTPAAVWNDPFTTIPYGGGAFVSRHALTWPAILSDAHLPPDRRPNFAALLSHRPLATADEATYGAPLRLFRQWLAHPRYDDYWRVRMLHDDDFRRITIPTLAFTGTFDEMHDGTIANYQAMQRLSSAGGQQFLVVGPWEHATVVDGGHDYRDGYRPARGVRSFGLPDQAFLDTKEIYGRFFDWCLKGGPVFAQASARIYLTGSDRWLDLPTYPPPNVIPTSLYLHSAGKANGLTGDGQLRMTRPTDQQASDRYLFDPLDPGGVRLSDAKVATPVEPGPDPVDLRAELERPDVLVYQTDPLDRPLTVVGPVELILFAATDGRDTDWVARIEDVGPDGNGIRLGVGPAAIVRARYRHGFEQEELLTPGEPVEYRLNFHHLGHTFQAGHRIRLSVSSAAYPWVHPNPNTGNPIATDRGPPRRARQTVFHDGGRPSHLVLPVLPD